MFLAYFKPGLFNFALTFRNIALHELSIGGDIWCHTLVGGEL